MPKNKPSAKKVKRGEKDYVGPYDGDTKIWMTRRKTDKGGNIEKSMVPNSSKPSEANDYHESFDRKKYGSRAKDTSPSYTFKKGLK